MAFSLMNGLSEMGKGIAQYAGTAGLEIQKADMQQQALRLADQLATTREQEVTQPFAEKMATATQAAETARNAATNAAAGERNAATISSEERRQQAALNAPSPEIKSAQQFSKLSKEEKQAYREEMMTKAGLPPWMIGEDQAGGPASAPQEKANPSDTAAPSGTPATGAPARANLNEETLKSLPAPAQSLVKGMVEGRISPPSSFAASKPYWQNLIQMATAYDPTFDETTWSGRVATRKDFAAGKSAQAVTALNTALSHASTLADDFDKMGNTALPAWNVLTNNVGQALGGAALTKATETRDALASEARKVFAASGGGNLTELQEWQKNFPLNGSPTQQKAALQGFVDLLDGRLQGLADQYNRGMGKADDPMTLLQPKARAAYEKLSGRTPPTDAVGYQTGKPPDKSAGSADAGTSEAPPSHPPLPPGFRVLQ